jgi:hypothetical protein
MLSARPVDVPADARTTGKIGIELPSGVRLTVDGAVDAEALSRVIGVLARLIPQPTSARIILACGVTDMRKGFDGLAVLVQQVLQENHIPVRSSRSAASAAT